MDTPAIAQPPPDGPSPLPLPALAPQPARSGEHLVALGHRTGHLPIKIGIAIRRPRSGRSSPSA